MKWSTQAAVLICGTDVYEVAWIVPKTVKHAAEDAQPTGQVPLWDKAGVVAVAAISASAERKRLHQWDHLEPMLLTGVQATAEHCQTWAVERKTC